MNASGGRSASSSSSSSSSVLADADAAFIVFQRRLGLHEKTARLHSAESSSVALRSRLLHFATLLLLASLLTPGRPSHWVVPPRYQRCWSRRPTGQIAEFHFVAILVSVNIAAHATRDSRTLELRQNSRIFRD